MVSGDAIDMDIGLAIHRSWVRVLPRHHRTVALGKLLTQGSHFLENQGMSGLCFDWNVRELSWNFAACHRIFFVGKCRFSDCSVAYLLTQEMSIMAFLVRLFLLLPLELLSDICKYVSKLFLYLGLTNANHDINIHTNTVEHRM